MDQKTFSFLTGVIFSVIAVFHLLRIVLGWQAQVAGWVVPMWFSWIGIVIAGFLAYKGLKFGKK